MTVVDVPGVISDIISDNSITDNFKQLRDERMAVTGGNLEILNDRFYLVGGQRFDGAYNPMGPNHGPGFLQERFDVTNTDFQKQTNISRMFVYQNFLGEWFQTPFGRGIVGILPYSGNS